MKTISVVGLLVMVSLVASGQMDTDAATDRQWAEGVVDTNGDLRVPADYRTAYQSLGSWVAARAGQPPRPHARHGKQEKGGIDPNHDLSSQ